MILRRAHRRKRLSCPPQPRQVWTSIAIAFSLCAALRPAHAGELYAGDGLAVELDTIVRYSAAIRLADRNGYLISHPNGDDGDRDFAPGQLFLNRFDFASVLNITADRFGFQASVDGWYDTIYDGRTANNSPATFNALSVPHTAFPAATRELEGEYLELGDAFAHANFAVAGMPVAVRAGRQTVLWGEGVFPDQDSIAAAQAPIDYWRNIAPRDYSASVYLPVTQIFVSVQPLSDVTIAAYYQFEWRSSRLPGVGSYFSASDYIGAGAERIFLGNGGYLLRTADRTPSGTAHFGLSLKAVVEDLDVAVYALRYASQYPWLRFTYYSARDATGRAGEYWMTFPDGISLFGGSISGYAGNSTIAAELSARLRTPIPGGTLRQQYQGVPNTTAASNYALADTLHAQVSMLSTLAPSALWDSAGISAQIGSTWLLRVERNPSGLDISQDRVVSTVRVLFEPHYFKLAPGIDLSLPLGFGYGIAGQSNLYFGPMAGAADFEAGISATYHSVWQARLLFTAYAGSPSRQPLADRDFVLFSIARSF